MSRSLQQWIEERAYIIWEKEGRPEGRSLAHWLQAEQEAMRDGLMGVTDDGRPVKSPPTPGRRARSKSAE
jgi:hypothetical protein